MYPLRELVHKIVINNDYPTTFASLLSKLNELHIDVAKEDKDAGQIVARCLTGMANLLVWRSWSDKLVFEILRVDSAKTQVKIYLVPNLFRFRIKKNEQVIEVKTLTSKLFV
jgi:hypothetical protein